MVFHSWQELLIYISQCTSKLGHESCFIYGSLAKSLNFFGTACFKWHLFDVLCKSQGMQWGLLPSSLQYLEEIYEPGSLAHGLYHISKYKPRTEVFQKRLMGFTKLFQSLGSAQVQKWSSVFLPKPRSFNTCIFLIFGSAESAGPDSTAEGCSTLQNSRTSHGWNLYHALTVMYIDCCNSPLAVMPNWLCWKLIMKIIAMCSNEFS